MHDDIDPIRPLVRQTIVKSGADGEAIVRSLRVAIPHVFNRMMML
jgi:hypothetical protein